MRESELNLVTTAESGKILGCVPDNVRKLAREGKLRVAFIVGGNNQRLFNRADVERLATQRAARRGHDGEAS